MSLQFYLLFSYFRAKPKSSQIGKICHVGEEGDLNLSLLFHSSKKPKVVTTFTECPGRSISDFTTVIFKPQRSWEQEAMFFPLAIWYNNGQIPVLCILSLGEVHNILLI